MRTNPTTILVSFLFFLIGIMSMSHASTASEYALPTTSSSYSSTVTLQPVPDTGITKCYDEEKEIPCPQEGDDFYGQDGNYSINPMSYTKLDESGNDLPISAVSAGTSYTVGLSNDGSLWTWGSNYYGQLGNGTTIESSVPIKLTSLSEIVAVSTGSSHTVAITSDGSVWAWGRNDYGQLGNGTTTDSTTPVKVTGIFDVTAIAAGDSHTVAITSDGSVWAWGANWYGMLGNGTTTDSSTPVKITDLSDVIAVDAGYHNTVAVTSDGSVWTWGFNASGQLGDGTTTDSSTPVKVNGLSGAIDAAVGADYIVAATSEGSVYAWGDNSWGQLGNGRYGSSNTPVKAIGLSGAVAVDASYFYTIALTNDGSVWVWGSYEWWLYSDGKSSTRPVKVPNLSCIDSVAAGYDNTVALTNSGSVLTWGYNRSGQLGNGTTTNSTIPVQLTSIGSNNILPTVTTSPATGITETSATLNGTYDSNQTSQDLSKFSAMYFEYGTTTDYGKTINIMDVVFGTIVEFSSEVTDLTPDTTYHFRLVMTEDCATYYGNDQTFTTMEQEQQVGSLTVTLSPQEAITAGGQWRVDSGEWQESGATVSNLTVGSHTVEFKDITDWTTPASQTVTVENGATAIATGNYVVAQEVGILTPDSPDITIPAGKSVKLFGTEGASNITLESGATAKLINFPGSNTITLKSDSTLFTISRSGAMVKFQGSDGTVLEIPATQTAQTIVFNDVSGKLVIENNQVMFGTQVVTLTAEEITGAEQTLYTKLDENGNDLPVTAESWSMVRDNTTGFIWENKNSKDDVKDYTNPNDADNRYTWYDSNPDTNGGYAGTAGNGTNTEDFIKALNDANFGGYSDWRMPTIQELGSIVDKTIPSPGPTINTNYFKDTIASYYWSSSTDAYRIYGAWGVYFDDGGDNGYYKDYYGYVRAVRGGQ